MPIADDEDDTGHLATNPFRQNTPTVNSSLLKHVLLAGFTGFVGVLFLTSILYEIATSSAFAICDGIILFLVAVAMALIHYDVISGRSSTFATSPSSSPRPQWAAQRSPTQSHPVRTAPLMTVVVFCGCLITLVAAVAVFMVRFAAFGPVIDVVFLVSASGGHCYALMYVLVDFSNYLSRGAGARFTARQVYITAASAVLVGTLAGLFFAAADVEDHVRRLSWEQWLCAGVGFLAGAGIGHANFHAVDASLQIAFDPLPMDDE